MQQEPPAAAVAAAPIPLRAPAFDVPPELLESAASVTRIRALAALLDPSVALDDGAVRVRVGSLRTALRATNPSSPAHPASSSPQLIDDLMGRWVEDVTTLGAGLTHLRARRDGGITAAASGAWAIDERPVMTADDLAGAIAEVWPTVLAVPGARLPPPAAGGLPATPGPAAPQQPSSARGGAPAAKPAAAAAAVAAPLPSPFKAPQGSTARAPPPPAAAASAPAAPAPPASAPPGAPATAPAPAPKLKLSLKSSRGP
jgi:hypothetical protein